MRCAVSTHILALETNFMMVSTMSLTTSKQLQAARVLLGWDQETIAKAAGVSVGTIRRLEQAKEGRITGHVGTIGKIEAALETAGIEFISEPGRTGVALRARSDAHAQ